jgi:prepilin-type N-terminal cleavage/methylation domain-containing protein
MTGAPRARAREESGFGLIELLAAMMVLSIAVGALLAVFTAGVASTRRAGLKSTATVLAERQLEVLHKGRWEEIHMNSGLLSTVGSPYATNNPRPSATQVTSGTAYAYRFIRGSSTATLTYTQETDDDLTVGSGDEVQVASYPSQIVRGADGKQYRVDSYVFMDGNNNEIKNITVYVYDYRGGTLRSTRPLAKATASLNHWQFLPRDA